MFVLEGCRSRPDLEARMDWLNRGRVIVMEKVPGAYVFISACPAEDYEAAPDNHSPRAAFDDSVVPDAAAWLAEVAVRRLRRER